VLRSSWRLTSAAQARRNKNRTTPTRTRAAPGQQPTDLRRSADRPRKPPHDVPSPRSFLGVTQDALRQQAQRHHGNASSNAMRSTTMTRLQLAIRPVAEASGGKTSAAYRAQAGSLPRPMRPIGPSPSARKPRARDGRSVHAQPRFWSGNHSMRHSSRKGQVKGITDLPEPRTLAHPRRLQLHVAQIQVCRRALGAFAAPASLICWTSRGGSRSSTRATRRPKVGP